eukprot:8955806-Pyramimonas_sp.AAC.1
MHVHGGWFVTVHSCQRWPEADKGASVKLMSYAVRWGADAKHVHGGVALVPAGAADMSCTMRLRIPVASASEICALRRLALCCGVLPWLRVSCLGMQRHRSRIKCMVSLGTCVQ